MDLPWFLHLSLALGKTCRKGSEPQEMYDFEKQSTHIHTQTKDCAEPGGGQGGPMPAGKAFWREEALSWGLWLGRI